MQSALLSAHREPIFAKLATDPTPVTPGGRTFAEIAAELLAPHSYGERHALFSMPGVDCSACAPFSVVFQAAPAQTGAIDPEPTGVLPIEGTVVKAGKRRRDTARQFGPAPKGGRH